MIQFRSLRGLSMVWLALSLAGPHSAALAESDDVVKQTYKRPAEIPFPLDNPYTRKKPLSARRSISIRGYRVQRI